MAEYFDVIASWFINKSIDENKYITPLKLQQLVYLSNCWHLGIKEEPLITQDFEAWKYGPVLQDLYFKYKHIGKAYILKREKPVLLNNIQLKLLEFCWDKYSFFTERDLTVMTNYETSPWQQTRRRFYITDERRISNSLIARCYKTKYACMVNKPI